MFDINNSRDFYQKLLEDFDDYMGNLNSARHALNCAIAAHHMHDWVWADFLKEDDQLRAKFGIDKKLTSFIKWIEAQSIWFGMVQSISNGSKHFTRNNAFHAQRVGGFGLGKWGEDSWGNTHLVVDMGGEDPAFRYMHIANLLEVVVRFWRDFMTDYSPYDDLPTGKTKLLDMRSDEAGVKLW